MENTTLRYVALEILVLTPSPREEIGPLGQGPIVSQGKLVQPSSEYVDG